METGTLMDKVSAFTAEAGLVLGQVATDQKSNELTATPRLLHTLVVAGGIVTIDAMGTQTAIAGDRPERGADCVLCVKGNHANLPLKTS